MELHWHTEPFLLISLLFFVWLYAVATGPLRAKITRQALPWYKPVFYYSGILLAYLTVGSPLDQIGEQFLFSAHMVQHMLLIYAIPFLIYAGLPHWLIDWPLQKAGIRKTVSFLFHPATGGVAFSLIYTLWHIPAAYEAALQNKTIHIIEHITIFVPAMMMLWCFVSPSRVIPAASYPIRMLVIFLLMIAQLPVFAFLSFSETVHYPTYEWAPRIIEDLSPLADQILGGVVMKVANMIVSITIFGLSFYLWARKDTVEGEAPAVYVYPK
jgi:putative membrane protein